ncbi:unnamed protein product [Didymodactylos carnosus]|uniref:Uncharacterized protein n=1 Tax=Didymodactylos carnosus TaxID=1234261 RepID=A0A813WS00_9BILA|nr:unnamed protein product [Didymodactylos carnosus]CAF1309235.1 unnamed protein product [Didymodactylos carnosus]CAF3642470.1 unnamed protein product [Didymodactylos carnosus]CAF4116862.1 unnamed protein product [Didymodactylos carnosus]
MLKYEPFMNKLLTCDTREWYVIPRRLDSLLYKLIVGFGIEIINRNGQKMLKNVSQQHVRYGAVTNSDQLIVITQNSKNSEHSTQMILFDSKLNRLNEIDLSTNLTYVRGLWVEGNDIILLYQKSSDFGILVYDLQKLNVRFSFPLVADVSSDDVIVFSYNPAFICVYSNRDKKVYVFSRHGHAIALYRKKVIEITIRKIVIDQYERIYALDMIHQVHVYTKGIKLYSIQLSGNIRTGENVAYIYSIAITNDHRLIYTAKLTNTSTCLLWAPNVAYMSTIFPYDSLT